MKTRDRFTAARNNRMNDNNRTSMDCRHQPKFRVNQIENGQTNGKGNPNQLAFPFTGRNEGHS